MNTEFITEFLEIFHDPESSQDFLEQAANQFYQTASATSYIEGQQVLSKVAPSIETLSDPVRASYVALLCGALLEQGFDPDPVIKPLLSRLQTMTADVQTWLQICLEHNPSIRGEEGIEYDLLEETESSMAETQPALAAQNTAFDTLWRPAVTLCSLSKDARLTAQPLRTQLELLQDFTVGGGWLSKILAVLDDEPILVLEPSTKLGFAARISGISDNFQLHTLLMDIFPNPTGQPRVTQNAADTAWARGAQAGEGSVLGYWNLYDWRAASAVQAQQLATEINRDYWVWGEGIPSDIPVRNGYRIILLGEPAYQRSWANSRMFGHLRPEFTDLTVLSTEDVQDWLEQLSAV